MSLHWLHEWYSASCRPCLLWREGTTLGFSGDYARTPLTTSLDCPLNNVHLSSKFLVKFKCWGLAKVEECISLICTWSINSWYILIRIFCYTSHIGWRRLAWMQLVGRVCSCERRRSSQKNISNIYCKLSMVCLWMTSFGKNQTSWGLDEKADKTAMLCLRTTDVFTVLFHLRYQLQIHGSITVLVNRFFCL